MSMRDYPCCGYVVEWNRFKKNLPIDVAEKIDDILDKEDYLAANDYLCTLDETHPRFEVFTPDDMCNLESMDLGVTYAIIDEKELFTKTPTPLMQSLTKNGCEPEFEMWTIWG